MKSTILRAASAGLLSLGMVTPTIWAQGGYGPAPGRYDPPAFPAYPDDGGYQPGPSSLDPSDPGIYDQPRDPYGHHSVAPPGPYRVYRRGYAHPVAPGLDPYGGFQPGPSPVVGLADQLVQQADTFLRGFAPTAGVVPQGRQFLAEASALRDAAARLRQAAAGGVNPVNELAAVEALYQRLEARMYRVSKGRVGPNIANALQMGQTIGQIRGLFR
jgi:hypothetical protein